MTFTIFYNEKAHFKAIKTRRWKNQKTDIFPKGLSLGFGAKMTIFLTSFFLGNIDEENIIFRKGLTHGFGPKMTIFPTFFEGGNTGKENVFYDILERKKTFLGYKNKKFKMSKNWHICKGDNKWFWSKNGHFSNLFLGNIGQKNTFYDILERKIAFQDYKNNTFKKSKNWHFSKGVNPRFWSKNGHFSNIFF